MELLLLLVSAFFVFFLPGFFISLIFFRWRAIDLIERLILSIGISFSVVPLLLFYGNMFGVVISAITVISSIATILFLSGIILCIQHFISPSKIIKTV